jgi:hypothetical protein
VKINLTKYGTQINSSCLCSEGYVNSRRTEQATSWVSRTDLSLLERVQTGSGVHASFSPVGTGVFPKEKVVRS